MFFKVRENLKEKTKVRKNSPESTHAKIGASHSHVETNDMAIKQPSTCREKEVFPC
jgi:hypothetical protein